MDIKNIAAGFIRAWNRPNSSMSSGTYSVDQSCWMDVLLHSRRGEAGGRGEERT